MASKERHNKKPADELTPAGVKRQATITLSKLIKQIGHEKHTIDDEGQVLTKFEALARLVWNRALGYTEEDVETGEKTVHKPDKGFINLVFDRTEGKVPTIATGGDKDKAKVADRVGEQVRSRINRLAERANND